MKTCTINYRAALYMRLSKDDDGVKESASISTQRKMLRSYAKENEYAVFDEYIDDGFSGTNFDRPDFKRMIQDIEDKKVNMVITKDLSRLGRDYIMSGQYTELYFPSKGVRYIAINDGYDSDSPYNDIAPFRHVINEMYARDTSKKIRSAFLTKMHDGSFIGNFAPYGYRKDPENKNHLLIDDETAAVVQCIFHMAEMGCCPINIARYLNNKKVPTPAMQRCHEHPYLDVNNYSQRLEWTSATISKMLQNIVYLGHLSQGKTNKVTFKSKITITKPREDWIVVEHTHEPLITQEAYDIIKERTISRTNRNKSSFHNIFSGLAKCMDCGRNMSTTGTRKKGAVANLVCGGYKLYGNKECSNHFIDYQTLYNIILKQLGRQLYLPDEERKQLLEEVWQEAGAQNKQLSRQNQKTIATLEGRSKQLDNIIEKLYEDNLSGKIIDERFKKLLGKYEEEQRQISENLQELEQKIETTGQQTESTKTDYQSFLKLLNDCTDITELNADLLYKLIDHIEIGQGTYKQTEHGPQKQQKIKIFYRFAGCVEP